MSLSHHGDAEELDLVRRLKDQIDGTARRSYPKGRMGAEDDGTLAYMVAADPLRQVVVIRFGKAVEWIGLGVDDVDALIEKLNEMKLKLRGVTV